MHGGVMGKARTKRLERLQATIREVPTDGTVIERCHDDVPDYQSQESLPVDSEDKPQLIEFDNQLNKYKGETYHHGLLKHALVFCRYRSPPTPNGDDDSAHGISFVGILEEPDLAEQFTNWITELHTKDGDLIAVKTEGYYRDMIRQYGDLVGEDGRPAHIENIKSVAPRKEESDYDPTPELSNILYWDDSVVPILESPDVHIRDKAIVAVAWETGCRPSELYVIEAGHLSERKNYLLLEVEDSKTYDRTPHLHVSLPYLRKWLLELDEMTEDVDLGTSPLSIPPEQPIWTRQKESEQLASSTFESVGRKVGDRLGFRRPTNLKQFRKSRASIIAASGVSQTTLRTRFGWSHGSSAPAHYIARFSDEANQEIADIDGASIEISEEHAEPSPLKCSCCEQWSPRHLDTCFWCGSEIEGDEQSAESELDRLQNKAEINQAAKSSFREHLSEVDVGGHSVEIALEIVEAMEANPELTKETIAFTLMTEHDGLGIERVIELLEDEDGDDDLRSILQGA